MRLAGADIPAVPVKRPEILAPAGDFVCLQAALDAGCDAVYFGLGSFNMRAGSGVNFAVGDLPEISSRCRAKGVKAYLALNAIMFEGEADGIEGIIVAAKPHVDAFIVSDWGVISLCRKHGAAFHVSTQMSTSNSAAVAFLASQGASRVVLARECTLGEVKRIAAKSPIEIEAFVHGAQCVAESGRCLMSHEAFGKSACRGECRQPCRRRFLVKAVDLYEDGLGNPVHESDTAFIVEPHTILSAKDLCSLGFVDRLMDAGIASFKIEGRARNAEYVMTCVRAYRRAVDAVSDGSYSPALVEELTREVEKVFHREFSKGLFYGRPGGEQLADSEDSLATTVKRHVGIVIDYFLKAGIVQVKIQDHSIRPGDTLQIHGKTTGVVELVLGEIRRDGETPESGEKGTWVTFAAPRCRVGDKVFFIETKNKTAEA
ncbi:MAG: U32 family peptidase [Kiritimatiellae bacterium]|nr:U32 family peptidase [Kiritimatiellia bacterium]